MNMPVLDAIDEQVNSRKRWTREQAAKLVELFPHERYELIEGELFIKMGQQPPHVNVVELLDDALAGRFGSRRVRIQAPIVLPDPDGRFSEPEPDFVVLHRYNPEFHRRHPGPQDIALLIEVADMTFAFDRSVKYRLYARTGIAEYWIIDVQRRRTVVCRHPAGNEYKSLTIFDAAEEITPLAAPEFVFSLERLLAPLATL
jgi:Uma2 family endonuclease